MCIRWLLHFAQFHISYDEDYDKLVLPFRRGVVGRNQWDKFNRRIKFPTIFFLLFLAAPSPIVDIWNVCLCSV